MKSAYLYVRVSTEEQKRKGYSLPEQEDRLLKYCRCNDIEVKGIFKEDYSAKNFNRPEWNRLLAIIKRSKFKEENHILFVRWDRYSRNIEYAYEMIGILRKHNTIPVAVEQPLDFSIPESTVMLAIALAVPEAENERRGLNTANGIRRAKQMGRYPNKAPLGFINLTGLDGKKYISPKQPEASIIKWAFHQIAKNTYRVADIRRMAIARGLKCSETNFWRLIRNPVFCGLVKLKSESEEQQLIKGIHTAIVSEDLFNEVQNIINLKKRVTEKKTDLNAPFSLKSHLICPTCGRKFCGSYSQGRAKKYPYYHCKSSCGVRFRADLINNNYNEKLQQFALSKNAVELFSLILNDVNLTTQKAGFLNERKLLLRQLEERKSFISKARKLFVLEKLKYDDYSEIKNEYQANTGCLKEELEAIIEKLRSIDEQSKLTNRSILDIFHGFPDLDLPDKNIL